MSRRLADVARKVGVSEATVSRVLNNKPGVSEATRRTVLTALDVLGYERPTKLRGERARLVGLVMPELQNPIFPAFAEVISGGLAQNGYTPVLCTQTAGGISESDYVELLLHQQVSGVIFVGGAYAQADTSHDHYERLRELNLPTVLVNAPVPDLDFATVSCDDRVSMEQAFSHLMQLGHSEIGILLGPTDHMPSRRKLEAAERIAGATGLELPARRIVHSLYSLEAGQAAATRLLKEGVTAMVCASDPMALGAVRAVRRAGLRVPEDISVIGYDDSALMNCTEPPLTTVRQPIESMGRMIVELLMRQMTSGAPVTDELLFAPELVVRASTGPAAVAATR
ncbi:LacI family DNA-binding transcriptional regulator [Leifsonia flava]|uniref:LacI family transcriptional regulator n=1 Tax=Orlajensenia leifsoniae TaxID=2561933 RepID=A0A4Y9QZS7_9MICO|nr:LacI family DNA-binding transcriptional regulator [Leifsonia flava]TFV98071.1 LacI family transcriptional regulator [Leifsonia flava]